MTGAMAPEPGLSTGQQFADRYEVEVLLGRGGMGAVYRARDLALGETVALKILSPLFGLSPVAVLRFRQEVRLSRRVTHPNVIRVYDIGEHEQTIYMTMELVIGTTLSKRLSEEGRLASPEGARIGKAVCDGLSAAHAAGVVHRDLKPSNVLLAGDGRVVLTDFGIAQSLHEASDLTLEGTVVGTRRYMAPEQLMQRGADARSDVYALGVMLHEMLMGQAPDRDQALTVAGGSAQAAKRGAGPGTSQASIPGVLGEIVARCLRADPAERPASAEEVSRVLAGLIAAPEPGPAGMSAGPVSAGPTERDGAPSRITMASGGPLAVLPFEYVGPGETAYLGKVIADELVDTLAQIRGLTVLGTGATGPFAERRDVKAAGAALRAPLVLDGTLQLSPGARVRVTARLLDATTGSQRWSGRHEGAVADLLAFQISIARVLAEKLRLELAVASHESEATAEAVDLYFAARRDFRTLDSEAVVASVEEFERCLAEAPRFLPAVSGLALASVRAWFFERGIRSDRDWEQASRSSVARALAAAPHLPETHLAAGMFAIQLCQFGEARAALDRALSIAPTYVDVLEYLGMLLCEAGHVDDAFARLRMVQELDPSRPFPLLFAGRVHMLLGNYPQAEELFSQAERMQTYSRFSATIHRVRAAAWLGGGAAPELSDAALAELATPRWALPRLYLEALRGASPAAILGPAAQLVVARQSPRAQTSVRQILSEIWLVAGDGERAMEELRRASDIGLLDLIWLDRCPLLAPLRASPLFAEVRRKTAVAAEAIRG